MKGSKCKCGFATVSAKRICPRCGKQMKPAEWPDSGRVLSFTRLQVIPEGFTEPLNMALVGVRKGPKLVCWTSGILKVDDEVTITEKNGKLLCGPSADPSVKLDKDQVRS